MRIGLIKETKPAERRVALTDAGVGALVDDGHDVLVERGAGTGIANAAYEQAGAKLIDTAQAWEDPGLAGGLNTRAGTITHAGVAVAFV